MEAHTVSSAAAEDRDKVVRVITAGFIADPIARWVWPDASTYLDMMPKFVAAFGGRAFDHGAAYVSPGHRAAALWLPPGIEPDEEQIMAIFAQSVPAGQLPDVASFFEQMGHYHPVHQLCWYLPLIAADPAAAGRGLGSAILAHALARCDEDGAIAYLESSNPRNIPLYERFGFEVIGEIQAGASPTMYPMLRPARRAMAA